MALHDFRCGHCGAVTRDINIPVVLGARRWARDVPCDECGQRTLEQIPAARFSVFADGGHSGGYSDFQKATCFVPDPGAPGGQRQETVGSLADIRRLERESEQRARNGEGGAMCWRDYSQDRTNRDRSTLGENQPLTPPKTYANGTPVKVRRGDAVTDVHGVPAEFQEQD